MTKAILGLITIGLLATACKKDNKATYIKDDISSTINQPIQNNSKISIIDQAGIKAPQATPIATTSIPNPPHGQPGHRCDIAVGQPLNISPQQINTSQVIQAEQNQKIEINTSQVQASNVKTAKGMNPPHGESGHRCDIPVGQPLNAKPSATSVQAVATNTPSPEQKIIEVGEKPKLNPPHGEPFHDCAKKVGDAL